MTWPVSVRMVFPEDRYLTTAEYRGGRALR
ncbi:hypothetical protein RHECNPAF_1340081 [Rhizobium etli CNPAF512]|nr:hypothetical protein RHECNPAF_1340081 [Rhizobium etli CNPAF512]